MSRGPTARWYTMRRAQNRKPATYRCPLCGDLLPALSEHMLITPEGDSARRRHAHGACVFKARKAGRLLTREEWERTQPKPPRSPGPLTRLRAAFTQRRTRPSEAPGRDTPDGDR